MQTVTATIAAWLILQERIGAIEMLGGIILLVGIYWVKRSDV